MRKTILTATALCLMAVTGIYAVVNTTIEDSNCEMIAEASFEVNPFCKAIMTGDIDMVKKLIDLGEDVNQKSLGMTPAIYAARYNKAEILELLIDSGANLKTKSDKGYTAKKYAEMSNATAALEVIETAMKK